MTLSSEALAVVPKLADWNAIFMSSDNGDGRLTGSSFVPNFFRANTSGPMGTRAVALYLRSAGFKSFYALGMDYAWGHNSIGVFKDEVTKAGKNFIADRHEGFFDVHHEDPAVGSRCLLHRDARRRQ
jgi:branched-chain amino acid transport system substrate-binding protein